MVGLSVLALAGGLALGGLVVGGLGIAVGYSLFAHDDAVPTLPDAVEKTRGTLLEAAESGDYEALGPLLSDELRYTFGHPLDDGPIAYWRELERTTDERPLEALAAILRMPYVLSRGYYVWPWGVHGRERRQPLRPRTRPAGATRISRRARRRRHRLRRLAYRDRTRRHVGLLRRRRLMRRERSGLLDRELRAVRVHRDG
jgi:hypothetical protein